LNLELTDDLAKLTTRIDSLKNSYDVDRLKKDFHQNEIADLKT
jgi:chromosome segregation ATPase